MKGCAVKVVSCERVPGLQPPGQLPPRTIVTQSKLQPGQLTPTTTTIHGILNSLHLLALKLF